MRRKNGSRKVWKRGRRARMRRMRKRSQEKNGMVLKGLWGRRGVGGGDPGTLGRPLQRLSGQADGWSERGSGREWAGSHVEEGDGQEGGWKVENNFGHFLVINRVRQKIMTVCLRPGSEFYDRVCILFAR